MAVSQRRERLKLRKVRGEHLIGFE